MIVETRTRRWMEAGVLKFPVTGGDKAPSIVTHVVQGLPGGVGVGSALDGVGDDRRAQGPKGVAQRAGIAPPWSPVPSRDVAASIWFGGGEV